MNYANKRLMLVNSTGVLVHTGGSWASTGMSFPWETWNTITLPYVPDSTQVSISINGSTAETFDITAGRSPNRVVFGCEPGTTEDANTIYIDAVPEPATLSLLFFGGFRQNFR